MNELALFILDIVQNSIMAHSKVVQLEIVEDILNDEFIIMIMDDGIGLSDEELKLVIDPFYTTRKTRDVGLGIPLFKELCEICNGSFKITSTYFKETTVVATLEYNHIDRPPLGNIVDTVYTLLINDVGVEIIYKHKIITQNAALGQEFYLSSIELKKVLNGVPMKEYDIMKWIKEYIETGLKSLEEKD